MADVMRISDKPLVITFCVFGSILGQQIAKSHRIGVMIAVFLSTIVFGFIGLMVVRGINKLNISRRSKVATAWLAGVGGFFLYILILVATSYETTIVGRWDPNNAYRANAKPMSNSQSDKRPSRDEIYAPTLTDKGFGKGNGMISVFRNDRFTGTIDVSIDGVYAGELDRYFPGIPPECGQTGMLNKILEAGAHRLYARNSDGMYWESTIYVEEGKCRRQNVQELKSKVPSIERPERQEFWAWLDKTVRKPKARSSERTERATVNKDLVIVYEQMAKNSTVVKSLKKGDMVGVALEMIGSEGGWCRITQEGQESTGFILCEDLNRPERKLDPIEPAFSQQPSRD